MLLKFGTQAFRVRGVDTDHHAVYDDPCPQRESFYAGQHFWVEIVQCISFLRTQGTTS